MKKLFLLLLLSIGVQTLRSQHANLIWNTQSKNSSESMPCGGGDIGMNVWVENDELLFYISRSGAFDEHNTLLKHGRVRVKLFPNPFDNATNFRQELNHQEGYIEIEAANTIIQLWADVFKPVIHLEINSKDRVVAEVYYENWRYEDRLLRKGEAQQNSYKWAIPEGLVTSKDQIEVKGEQLIFYHHNPKETVFDKTVAQQGMENVKGQLFNPIAELIAGGCLWGNNLKFETVGESEYAGTDFRFWKFVSKSSARKHTVNIALHIDQTSDIVGWERELNDMVATINPVKDKKQSREWWNRFNERSFIKGGIETRSITLNYTLFRYMLGCNAYGAYPTKFNGGLFTFDPGYVDEKQPFTPDYRKWGGGTMTAQNQRLVYFPLLKSGDFDLMPSQFRFYTQMQKNAELRSQVYWGHSGACFSEQTENFALPNPSEYGWKRPDYFDKGVEYNAWLEYQWDTVLEFCLMMLDMHYYTGDTIDEYIPFIESCLTFFDQHYRTLARQRGRRELDGDTCLILYPSSACETYKMAYNATPLVSGLSVILEKLIDYPHLPEEKREQFQQMLSTIPPISFRTVNGKEMIAPAKSWERINNVETPQLYPVYPWRIYGLGKEGLETAVNTYFHDPDALRFRSHIGWKQDNIFAACLGLTEEAKKLIFHKLSDGPHRFPAFWGPGYDWTPDHNWGGSGMIGLQEMLLQTNEDKIYLFPAWPKEWDIHFKLHAPGNTIVEAKLENGEIVELIVSPEERKKDIVVF